MDCINPKYINTTNVNNFGFSTKFNPYTKTVYIDTSGLTTYKVGGQANITNITFTIIDPQENTHTYTIDPSNNELSYLFQNMPNGLLFFGEYKIKGVLTEANANTYEIAFEFEVCDTNKLTAKNYIKGCISMEANCVTAKLLINDDNNYSYKKLKPISINYENKLFAPIDPDGELEEFTFSNLPYQKNIADYYTGTYQLSSTAIATYDFGCNIYVDLTFKSNLTKTITCTSAICDMNCCISDAMDIIKNGGQKGALMQEKMNEAMPFFNQAVGLYLCGANAEEPANKVRDILGCECICRQYKITPAPITLGNKNLFGQCGTSIEQDENGDYIFHSFVYTLTKLDPNENGFSLETTQINNCTKQTTIAFDYDNIQNNVLIAIANNPTFIQNWQDVLGITNCPCENVEATFDINVDVVNTDYDFYKLEDNYFIKNDVINGVEYQTNINVSGTTVDFIQFNDQCIQNSWQVELDGGQNIIIPCLLCGDYLSGKIGQEMYITTTFYGECGCIVNDKKQIEINKVQYSERYTYGYRFNPQINDAPIITYKKLNDNGIAETYYELIYSDSYFQNSSGSAGATVRSIKMKLNINSGNIEFIETRTLFGRELGAVPSTPPYTAWGDVVELSFISSINIDHDEVVNGYPVLYFTSYSGGIFRAVRERETECDERKNWKIYVLQTFGSSTLYGMKKWKVDENGNLTFLVANNAFVGQKYVHLFNYKGVGSKNNSNNWEIYNILTTSDGVAAGVNINIDNDNVYMFVVNNIKVFPYSGTNSLSDLQDPTNYTTGAHTLASGTPPASAVPPISYLDGNGATATIDFPNSLWKVGDKFYFSNERINSAQRGSYIRYFTIDVPTPTSNADYTFYTEIVNTPNSNLSAGTWVDGVSATMSGETYGMCFLQGLGYISIFEYGVRIFDFTNNVCTIFTGNEVANGNLSNINLQMDTQFEYKLL